MKFFYKKTFLFRHYTFWLFKIWAEFLISPRTNFVPSPPPPGHGVFDSFEPFRGGNEIGARRRDPDGNRSEGSGRRDSTCHGPGPTRSDPCGPRRPSNRMVRPVRRCRPNVNGHRRPRTLSCTDGRRKGIACTHSPLRPPAPVRRKRASPLGAGRSGIGTRAARLTATDWPTAGRFGWSTKSWPAESSTQNRPSRKPGRAAAVNRSFRNRYTGRTSRLRIFRTMNTVGMRRFSFFYTRKRWTQITLNRSEATPVVATLRKK